MKDYFHEARTALKIAEIEYTAVSSLSAMGAYATNQACENAVRGIWEKATGNEFPHEQFKPFHKPATYLKRIGLFSYYSPDAQQFLEKQVGCALDEVRYDNSQAYRDHTKLKNKERGNMLIAGTLLIIEETEKLSESKLALEIIRNYENKVGKDA
jgi:hypothetical protein